MIHKKLSEYKKHKLSLLRANSIENDHLETNKSESSNETVMNSPVIKDYQKKNKTIESRNNNFKNNETFKENLIENKTFKSSQNIKNNNSPFNKTTASSPHAQMNILSQSNKKQNGSVTHKHQFNKTGLDFSNLNQKYELINIIPKTSYLYTDEHKFISRGEIKKLIDSKKNLRKKSQLDSYMKSQLTPFQKNEQLRNLLREKLITCKDINGQKAILMKKSYEEKQKIDPESLNHYSSTCTIFNFNKNKNSNKENFKEIILAKVKNDETIVDFNATTKEILPNIGYNFMSSSGIGK